MPDTTLPSPQEIQRRRAVYERLIAQYESALMRAAWRMCGGVDDCAEELVQETLVRGYEAFLHGRFQEGTNARAWLLKIMMNCFLNDLRTKKRFSDVTVDTLVAEETSELETLRAMPSDRPEAALMASTLEEPMERALGSLSEELRTCVVLVDIEGFAYAEAAEMLRVPIGTVRSRLSRARLQLHALLYDYARARRRV